MSKQAYSKPDPVNIPPELRAVPQWGNWHGDKVIRNGSSTNPSTWKTFDQARRRDPDHLVFVFRRDGGLVGIDLDHCRNPETGEIEPWAQVFVDRFPHVYWEVSLSGTGLHGVGYGALPTEKSGWHPDGIGAFHHSRYFVVTGNVLAGHETLGDFGDDLADWCRETFPPESEPSSEPFTRVGLSLATEEIIDRAARAANGATFREYYGGGCGNKPSMSEARYALIGACLFWTQDPGQIEEIIRSSGQWTRKIKGRPDLLHKEIQDQLHRYHGPIYGDRQQPTSSAPPQDIPAGATCDQQLKVALETIAIQAAKLKAAEGTIATLRERVRRGDERWAVVTNTNLSAARQTAAVLPSLFQDERPQEPASATGYRVPLDRLADRTGLAPETCSKHLQQLAKFQTTDGSPVLHVETRYVPPHVDQSTGEIVIGHKEVWIGPGPIPQDAFGHVLATLAPAEAPKHGGAPDRNACPDHPFAGVIRRTKTTRKVTRECAHCNTILNVEIVPIGPPTAEFIPATPPIPHDAFRHESGDPGPDSPIPHDAFRHESGDPGPDSPIPHDAFGPEPSGEPMPQHAATPTSHTPDKNQSRKMRHSSPPQRRASFWLLEWSRWRGR